MHQQDSDISARIRSIGSEIAALRDVGDRAPSGVFAPSLSPRGAPASSRCRTTSRVTSTLIPKSPLRSGNRCTAMSGAAMRRHARRRLPRRTLRYDLASRLRVPDLARPVSRLASRNVDPRELGPAERCLLWPSRWGAEDGHAPNCAAIAGLGQSEALIAQLAQLKKEAARLNAQKKQPSPTSPLPGTEVATALKTTMRRNRRSARPRHLATSRRRATTRSG